MIATRAILETAAKRRRPGYLEAALQLGTPIAPDTYRFGPEALAKLAAYRAAPEVMRGPGLGTRLQRGIHAVLDAVPMPAKTRAAIKSCGGCAQRRAALDRAFPGAPAARPFTVAPPPAQSSP